MVKIAKAFWSVLDLIYTTFWGVTTADLILALSGGITVYDSIERVLQVVVTLSPAVYLWIRHIARKPIRKEEARRIKLENDIKEEELKEKRLKNDKNES